MVTLSVDYCLNVSLSLLIGLRVADGSRHQLCTKRDVSGIKNFPKEISLQYRLDTVWNATRHELGF